MQACSVQTKMIRHLLSVTIFVLAILQAGCAGTQYEPAIAPFASIDKVQVSISYKRDGIYQVQVVNNLPAPISLIWDESVYVNTAGIGTKLIHIPTQQDLDKSPPHTQKPSTIAPHGRLQTEFVGESWIDYARRGVTPRPRDVAKKAKIDLTFSINGKRAHWRAEVGFTPTD
jgi:hypothetical protein